MHVEAGRTVMADPADEEQEMQETTPVMSRRQSEEPTAKKVEECNDLREFYKAWCPAWAV